MNLLYGDVVPAKVTGPLRQLYHLLGKAWTKESNLISPQLCWEIWWWYECLILLLILDGSLL